MKYLMAILTLLFWNLIESFFLGENQFSRSFRFNMVAQFPFPRLPNEKICTPTNNNEIINQGSDESYQNTYTPLIIGIAGGSASGKTTLAKKIIEQVGEDYISFIGHDNYYKCLQHLSLEERAQINFDHPNSLDTELLIDHIRQLKRGVPVQIPTYDFSCHMRRREQTELILPRKIILIDGILIFTEPSLLDLMDLKIFVDTDDDIRLIRRIGRDTKERGRSLESIIEQYLKTVRPMHDLYVEPSKRKADIIIPAGEGVQPAALEMCVSRLREIVNLYQ